MIKLQTYCLEPADGSTKAALSFNTEWLRMVINGEVRDKSDLLKSMGADPSLFYNHDTETGRTRVGYPLIIYHYFKKLFYITGINEGAFALEILAGQYPSDFTMKGILFRGFRKENTSDDSELGITGQLHSYQLIEWRPVHHTSRNAFMQMDMVAKVKELNLRLEKHITSQLGKYLGINFGPLRIIIIDITRVYEPVAYKMRHKYPAFDIRFTANAAFPALITLGNHQALGFGRIVPV